MALIDTYMIKFRPDLPYMTDAEARLFKRLVDSDKLSIFKQGTCKRCSKSVPKVKSYCSASCYEGSDESEGEDDRVVDGPNPRKRG